MTTTDTLYTALRAEIAQALTNRNAGDLAPLIASLSDDQIAECQSLMVDRVEEMLTERKGSRRAEIARKRFLGDIITGAVEGGTGYWAQVSQYQYEYDGDISVNVGQRVGNEPRAVLHQIDDETGYEARGLIVTLDVVQLGIDRISDGTAGVNTKLRNDITFADAENDGGDIDAEAADVIVQAGLFGEVRYG